MLLLKGGEGTREREGGEREGEGEEGEEEGKGGEVRGGTGHLPHGRLQTLAALLFRDLNVFSRKT